MRSSSAVQPQGEESSLGAPSFAFLAKGGDFKAAGTPLA
jgi:hypothetical protein